MPMNCTQYEQACLAAAVQHHKCLLLQPVVERPRPSLNMACLAYAPRVARSVPVLHPRAARARLDAAERQGKAFDQQLELLAAVRAYFAEHQRAALAAAGMP